MLAARWQRETGQTVDLILQAGDLGCYPDAERLDKATIRHAERDPTELGFLNDFARSSPRIAALLADTTCPLVFVRGNHEDQRWLDARERGVSGPIFSVDAYQRIWCLRTGVPYRFSRGAASIQIVGVGRIGAKDGDPDVRRSVYIQPEEARRLRMLGAADAPDLLLTHDSARDEVTVGYGMHAIREFLDRWRPQYHIYGHTGKPCMLHADSNGVTSALKLSDLNWRRDGALETGVMAHLRWDGPDNHELSVIDAAWLNEYSRYGWHYR